MCETAHRWYRAFFPSCEAALQTEHSDTARVYEYARCVYPSIRSVAEHRRIHQSMSLVLSLNGLQILKKSLCIMKSTKVDKNKLTYYTIADNMDLY